MLHLHNLRDITPVVRQITHLGRVWSLDDLHMKAAFLRYVITGVEGVRMQTLLPDIVNLSGWTFLSIPLLWLALVRIWDQAIGDRDMGANLIIAGLALLWAAALSLWI